MPDRASPDLESLKMLRTVVQSGSIAAAAPSLNRTQQAVSARMRTLEKSVGMPLLLRGRQGVTPTAAGSLLLTWAEEVIDAADRLDAGIRTLRGTEEALVRIGSSQTIAETLLPRWLNRLHQTDQQTADAPTSTELRVGNSTEIAHLVRTREIELGFVETFRLPDDLRTVRLGEDELVTVVSLKHPWAARSTPLSLAELADTPLVMREQGSGTRDAFADILAAHNPLMVARPLTELGTSAAVRSAISAGIAPGVLSRLAVRDDLILGRLATVTVEAPPFLRPITALHRQRKLSAGATKLLRIAREHFTPASTQIGLLRD